MKRKLLCLCMLSFVLVPIRLVWAQIQPTSKVILFTGSMPGQPDGQVDLRFKIFNASTEGNVCFEETQLGVQVTAEAFSVFLGDATNMGIPATPCFDLNTSLWAAFALNGTPDVEIGSRTPITSSGFAHYAKLADSAQSSQATHIAETLIAGATVSGGTQPNPLLNLINNGNTSALRVDNTAAGPAGVFRTLPANSLADALTGEVVDGAGAGVVGLNRGGGEAGKFEIRSLGNGSDALVAATNGGGAAGLFRTTGRGAAGVFDINNAQNNSEALSSRSNGGGNTVAALNTGSGGAGNFEIRNASSVATALFGRTNGPGAAVVGVNVGPGGQIPGLGRAGDFEINNANNPNDALYASTNGTGSAIFGINTGPGGTLAEQGRAGDFQINNFTNSAAALFGSTIGVGTAVVGINNGSGGEVAGQGRAADFRITHVGNSAPALAASTIGTGGAGVFEINRAGQPANESDALTARTNSTGRAGLFEVQNRSNMRGALLAKTDGSGSAVEGQVESTGSTAMAGYFHVDSGSNDATALLARTRGGGGAGRFEIDSPGNRSRAVFATTNGTGSAGQFQIDNTVNSANALVVSTNGRGSAIVAQHTGADPIARAGDFQITNAANRGVAMYAATRGTGPAGAFQINNPSNAVNALVATTDGGGSAGTFQINNSSNDSAGIKVTTVGRGIAVDAQTISGPDAVHAVNSGSGRGLFVSNVSTTQPTIFARNSGAVNAPPVAQLEGFVEIGGNVLVRGRVDKLGGTFRIDHPLDPEHKYLFHSFVESPDMKNVYDGTIVLDQEGEAWVELPAYFEALNKDFRYQLTCIGGHAPVYIAQKISQNRFRIAGGRQGLEVSWQITGIRKDPYAEKNRVRVEEDKPASEQGYYLDPEVYGQPDTKGIFWARNRRE